MCTNSEGTIKKVSVSSNNSNIISNETFEYGEPADHMFSNYVFC